MSSGNPAAVELMWKIQEKYRFSPDFIIMLDVKRFLAQILSWILGWEGDSRSRVDSEKTSQPHCQPHSYPACAGTKDNYSTLQLDRALFLPQKISIIYFYNFILASSISITEARTLHFRPPSSS
jgi:hypothetical protein